MLHTFYSYEFSGVTWMCRRCTESEPYRLKKNLEYKHLRRDTSRRSLDTNQTVASSGVKTLSYDVRFKIKSQ